MNDDMAAMIGEIANSEAYLETAANVVLNAQAAAARSVNLAMTYAYFEIGRIVAEEEQSGSDRAEYGRAVIANVSTHLTEEFGRGFSMTNIEQMRKFYRMYSCDEIPQKASEEFGANYRWSPKTVLSSSDELKGLLAEVSDDE